MESTENQYVKRTQKDYSYAFKLQVVSEVERGELSKKAAQRKYGIQGDATIRSCKKINLYLYEDIYT
jgi:transposase-like protein